MLVIGLDLGTQSCKAIVCDAGLRVLGAHAMPIETRHLGGSRVEQDPRAWEAALGPAIAGALAAARAQPADIAALAIAGQLDGCIAVDASGAPLHPALIWQDRRATAEAARADAAALFATTGQVADASHLAPKAAWLAAQGIAAARFHQPVSYLVERLTGEAALDLAHASTTMLFELAARRWSAELLARFGIREDQLPRAIEAHAIAGTLHAAGAALTGLLVGTPVATGTGDDFANALGAGVVAPGIVSCTLGTAEVVGALAASAILDRLAAEPMLETHVYPAGGYFVENPGWLSGGAVRWAARLFGFSSDAELDAAAASAPPGAGGVTFVPALAGAMTPVWRPAARGTFHGLGAEHDRSHLARAVLEGLAFGARDVVERLAALQLASRAVIVSGGGARSRVWLQLRADALGIPHRAAAHVDASPVGAAMLAAVAAGLAPDLATAAQRLPPPADALEPDAAMRPALDDAYARYQDVAAQVIT